MDLAFLAIVEDSPDSFEAYYELIHGNRLPKHSREEIEQLYAAHEQGKGALTFAWRGSWKSTVISVTFQSYRIGKEPKTANLTIGSNDDSPENVTSSIARIIELHPAWKAIFPVKTSRNIHQTILV